MNASWESIKNKVRQFRTDLQATYPIQVLTVIKDYQYHDNKLYFLSNKPESPDLLPTRYLQLYCIDLATLSNDADLNITIVFTEYRDENGQLQPITGVSTFDIKDTTIVFTFNQELYISTFGDIPHKLPSAEPRLDIRLNCNGTLISFIRNSDLWVVDAQGIERQLTFSCLQSDTTLKHGIAEYMMQEEFHRFTGYYWSPVSPHCLVYLETSEQEVDFIDILNDKMRYPRAGKPNAHSVIKLIEVKQDVIVYRKLWGVEHLDSQFDWMEYIVRFNWLPSGNGVWLQLLSRDQKRTSVICISIDQFTVFDSNMKESRTRVIWHETNDMWINVTDLYYFLDDTKFIWSSEKDNGYRHLYLIDNNNSTIKQLTSGDWCCVDKPLYIDQQFIYFSAKKESPLETHFYSLDYLTSSSEPTLLTTVGYNHSVLMILPNYYIDSYSTLHQATTTIIHQIDTHRDKVIFSIPADLTDNAIPDGEIFTFTTSDNIKLYGCLYKPQCYKEGNSYPTVLHIYGGPKTQLVLNEFKFPRLLRYLMSVYFGFAVVIIDSRGSSDRGLHFESHIEHKLGLVELKDQIEGLRYIHDTRLGTTSDSSVIDLERVAITGWSYGGYLSLMAIAKYPGIFKMAIAGAPVTQWELYDTAYTERYMGLPCQYPLAYKASNILSYIDQFPTRENRVLIAHGLVDENVHFRNTELLVAELVKQGKPHYLQVYPSEKHGLRHASVNEHFETLMFYWLTNYL